MRKILVLRGGALGDFIITLPALALLRRRWSDARIELAGNASAAALGLDCGLLDAAHSQHEARWSALFGTASLPAAFAAWLADFDLVVNFWPDPVGELRGHFPLRAGQTFLRAEAQPTLAPAAAYFCEPLRALGLSSDDFAFALRRPEPEARLIAIHPGSGSPRKNWPLEHWSAVGEWLRLEFRAKLVIVAGEAESSEADTLARFGVLVRNAPLRDLAARLARCRLFLGHDSGVSHLAAACSVPCVLLFGPTDPAMWAPPGPHVTVLKRGSKLATISIDEVKRAVASALVDRK